MLELIAAFIGVVALLLVIIVLLLPSPTRQPIMSVSTPLSVGSTEFMATIAGLLHTDIKKGGAIEIIDNGDNFLPDLLQSIQHAHRTINITDFIWKTGTFSDQVFDALTAAAARGVQVRVLTDAQQTILSKDKLKAFETAGGRFEQFHRMSPFKIALVNKRTHRRAMIFDGTEAYLGGIAIDDAWLGDGRTKGKWRDLMFRVHDTMALSVQSAFADEWYETTGEVIAGDAFYPNDPQTGSIPYINIVSQPNDHWSPIESLYLLSLRSAKKNIYIQNPYFLPDSELLDVLENAARSGVDVRVMVPKTVFSPVGHAAEINYSSMLDAGIKLYEYQTLMHTKTITIDGVWSIIGSSNFDNRSRHINNENVFAISDTAFAKEIEASFQKDVGFSQEITKDSWGTRWLIWSWYAYLSGIFAKQY